MARGEYRPHNNSSVLCLLSFISLCYFANAGYVVDSDLGLGRRFDGIGGLSGGGATSKLLVNYAEPYRSQILDYLFKPNFGASLHILKVEIGGDVQSTDGTESSHQHEEWDENYERGYEWWLMVEAKKRNPNIKLYGLPWGYPGWLGGATDNPFVNIKKTADYVTRWVNAAKKIYGLDMDYIGIWNERGYNTTYIKTLRSTLDAAGFTSTRLVVADGGWGIAGDVLKDPALKSAVDVLGAHYPGTLSSAPAVQTGLQLWASEDFSTFNDNVGAGCWARILNQNYVNGNMTSTISWNLIASYYQNLPFGRTALMTALQPWSGHFVVESPIWVTAHTTQFTNTTWRYLKHGLGSGILDKGGSYVSLVGPAGDFTMVIETVTRNHSICIRPYLPEYTVTPQMASFQLKGSLAKVTQLNVWYSKLGYKGQASELFSRRAPIPVVNGQFMVTLDVDVILTLTTVSAGLKGAYNTPPISTPFPLPYFDDYNSYHEYEEASDFAPQIGVWEVRATTDPLHGKVNRQVVLQTPVKWCSQPSNRPINIGGNYNWTDISVQADVFIPRVNGTTGAFVGARVNGGGCNVGKAQGLFFSVSITTGKYVLSLDMAETQVVVNGDSPVPIKTDTWYKLTLVVRGDTVMGFINTQKVFFVVVRSTSPHGFAAMGTLTWGYADFDNFLVQEAK